MRIKHNGMRKALTLSLLACFVQITCYSLPVLSANTASGPATTVPMTEQTMSKEVGFMENRFFAHQYANDPMEKRLERLELMIFGGTQDGTNDERFHRLKKIIAERPQQTAKPQPTAGSSTTNNRTGGKADKETNSSLQYPVLNTLEWRALKKTFPNESLDQRLARVEQKLFGQDSPTMAYVDRVDRLKRTLGVGVTATQQTGPMGPAPKARPHSGMDSFGYGGGMPFFGTPGGGGLFGAMPPGFGDDGSDALGPGISRTFAQMFQEMNRELGEFNKLGPGNWVFDQESGDWVEQGSGKKVHPGPQSNKIQPSPGTPAKPAKPFAMPKIMPRMQPQFPLQIRPQESENQMPPYTDPNSI